MSRLPLRFEANAGQWDPCVRFVTHGNGTTLFITDDAMTITLRDVPPASPGASRDEERRARQMALAGAKTAVVTMRLVGARPSVPVGEAKIETKSNFFVGNDPTKWRTNVPNFAEVRAKHWVPGVDVVWHGGHDGLEYDLDVAAGTDASLIALDVEGASALAISDDGALEIETLAGTLVQRPPRVMQDGKELRTRYRLDGARRVAFEMDSYERGRPVLIDPVLVYSTYLGGAGDEYGGNIAVDANGSAYVVGHTNSTAFPTANPAQGSYAGGVYDVFVTKLSPAGSALVYSTYLGGSAVEYGVGIAVDAGGNAYVTGQTGSTDFPTANALQGANGGGQSDAFVTKLSPAGNTLLYSTYLGGPAQDGGDDIAVDGSGSAYVTGFTTSSSFPTVGAAQGSLAGNLEAFVAKLSAAGTTLAYSTFLGGTGDEQPNGIAVDASGSAYVTGQVFSTNFPTVNPLQGSRSGPPDAFVTKLNPAGNTFLYSTYLGGSGAENSYGIAVDANGSAYLAGQTSSTDFPTSNPAQASAAGSADGFVTKLSPAGNALAYSTYVGGSGNDYARGIAVDASGSAYVAGATFSTDFPTVNAVQGSHGGGGYDAFVTKLSPAGNTLGYSTFLGGSGYDYGTSIASDASGSAYVAGSVKSTNFPTVGAVQGSYAGGYDRFIAKLTDGPVALGISPSPASVAPKGSKTFVAYGGSGIGYAFSLSTNASGASINPSTGAYTAGSTPNVTDVVQVTDSVNGVAIANVNVGAGISVSPSSPAPAPKATVNFLATGGSGTGFTWSLTSNNSGATINASTGAYTAGSAGSVTDVVNVVDSLGNTASVNVNVGAGVAILPASPSCSPKASLSFSASGGSGAGFAWSLLVDNSGGTINPSTGAYAAGATGSVTDTVAVTDSLGNVASATVTVGPGIAVTPPAPSTAPKGAISFGATGGSGAGYAWSISTNASGGTINASTGAYAAGATSGVTDTVTVTDSLGNIGSATVTVGPGIAVTPSTPSTPPKGAISFGATGGSGAGYTWSLSTNASGGTINASTGAYTAGATGAVTDTVAVVDSLGNAANVAVTVGAGIGILPSLPSAPPNGAITFSAVGGSGTGYVWSITSNQSGANIKASTGDYVAGATGKVADTVSATDSLGNTASVNVSVGGGLAINPASPTAPPKGAIAFSVQGGSGKGFVWAVTSNESGATIDPSSGAYTAGPTGNVADVIAVTDSVSNTSTVNVTVSAGLSITPTNPTVGPGASVAFSAAGGSGKDYTWSLATNDSGGNVTNGGVYTAGPTTGADTIRLVDSLGNTATTSVSVELTDAGASNDGGAQAGSSGGCGCRIVDRSSPSGGAASLFVLLAAMAWRRRRTLRAGRGQPRR